MKCSQVIFDEEDIKSTLEGLRDILHVINNRLQDPNDWDADHIEKLRKLQPMIVEVKAAIWQMLQP